MIKSKRELAIQLGYNSVNIDNVSKRLYRIIRLWESRNEIHINNGIISLSK